MNKIKNFLIFVCLILGTTLDAWEVEDKVVAFDSGIITEIELVRHTSYTYCDSRSEKWSSHINTYYKITINDSLIVWIRLQDFGKIGKIHPPLTLKSFVKIGAVVNVETKHLRRVMENMGYVFIRMIDPETFEDQGSYQLNDDFTVKRIPW